MAVKTLLSLEEFRQLPDDGTYDELDEGELIRMPPPNWRHGSLQSWIAHLLWEVVKPAALGTVFTETGFVLGRAPDIVRAPDVSFVGSEKLKTPDIQDWLEFAPDLAIEIVSPSDTAAALERKVRQYLRAGAHTVWVVYPEERTLHVYEASGASRVLDANQTLTAEDLLPGLSIPVSKLFE